VDVPRSLLDKLKILQESSQSLLVFPSAPHPTRKSYGGGIDSHMLETCKKVAFRAGIDCGHGKGTYTIKHTKCANNNLKYVADFGITLEQCGRPVAIFELLHNVRGEFLEASLL
jgi:hypothetical protein